MERKAKENQEDVLQMEKQNDFFFETLSYCVAQAGLEL